MLIFILTYLTYVTFQFQSLRKYEECYESARRAKESYEKAHEDLDLSRAQLEKARDNMTSKSKISDDAHSNYSAQVSLFNDAQRLFHERQLPSILNDLQQLDGKRSDELKDVYVKHIQSHVEVLPRVQRCLDEMNKQVERLNAGADARTVIDEYKSGYTIPEDEKEVRNWILMFNRANNIFHLKNLLFFVRSILTQVIFHRYYYRILSMDMISKFIILV